MMVLNKKKSVQNILILALSLILTNSSTLKVFRINLVVQSVKFTCNSPHQLPYLLKPLIIREDHPALRGTVHETSIQKRMHITKHGLYISAYLPGQSPNGHRPLANHGPEQSPSFFYFPKIKPWPVSLSPLDSNGPTEYKSSALSKCTASGMTGHRKAHAAAKMRIRLHENVFF